VYDNDALNLSEQFLPEQIAYVKNCFQYIRQIIRIDSEDNMKADYFYGIDAVGIDTNGNSHTIQFKARQKDHNDIVLLATGISGYAVDNNDIGFQYKGSKYVFLIQADIYCERLGNGRIVNFLGSDIMALEYGHVCDYVTGIQPKYIYADDNTSFKTDNYYVFVDVDKFMSVKNKICEMENRDYYGF
jgi:hypothetical protein